MVVPDKGEGLWAACSRAGGFWQALSNRQRPLRLRRRRPLACLLCYLIAFSLPLLWQYAALRWVYPVYLAATAPPVAESLSRLFPAAQELVAFTLPANASAQAHRAAQTALEEQWFLFVMLCAGAAWGLTLLLQLFWRFTRRAAIQPARATQRAVRAYRILMTGVWAVNLLAAGFLWRFGVSLIAGRTHWDWLCYFGAHALNVLAALVTSRLAAPSALSGRHAFFKRL